MEMGRVFLPIMANGSPKRFTDKVTNIWVRWLFVIPWWGRPSRFISVSRERLPTNGYPLAIRFSQLPSTFKGESSWFANKITIEKSGGKQDKCQSALKIASYVTFFFFTLVPLKKNPWKTVCFDIWKKRFPQTDHFQVESLYNPNQPRPFLDLGHFWKLFYHGKMRKGPPHHDGVDSCRLHLSNLRLCRVWNIW